MADETRFLAEQVPIDAVMDRGFRFGGKRNSMSHQGHLIGVPGRTQNWDAPGSLFDAQPSDFSAILAVADDLDLLIVGSGRDIALLPEETQAALREAGLAVEVSGTRAAVRTYNVLLSEDRRVATALMAVT